MSDEMFKEAVKAIKAGQRARGKDLLTRLVKADQNNANYWLWMSVSVDTEKEQIFCLQKAIKVDPNSIPARRGLVLLGVMKPEEAALPPPTEIEEISFNLPSLQSASDLGGRLQEFWSRPRNRYATGIAGGVFGIIIVLAVIYSIASIPRVINQVVVTDTPTASPTFTVTPTQPTPTEIKIFGTVRAPTATPEPCTIPHDPIASTPLPVYLCLTLTPSPVPIATDASQFEAYNTMKKAYAEQNWERVLSKEREVLQLLPNNAKVSFYLAEAYRHTGNTTEALNNYRDAITKDRNFAPAHWGKALIELGRNQTTEANKTWERGLTADGTFIPIYLDRASYYSSFGNTERALADLQTAAGLAPENALVQARLALGYAESGLHTEALNAANQAIALDPSQPLAYYARGRAQYAVGNIVEAERDLSISYPYLIDEGLFAQWFPAVEILKLDKLFQANVNFYYGVGQLGVGEKEKALVRFNQAIALYTTFAPPYLERGYIRLENKTYESARDDFESAVSYLNQANPPDTNAIVRAYVGDGLALIELNLPDGALGRFLSALKVNPDSFDANLGLGRAFILGNKYNEALDALDKTFGLAQTNAQFAQVHYARSLAFKALGRTAEEIADLQELAALTAEPFAPTAVARLTQIGPLPTVTPTPEDSPTPTNTNTPAPASATPQATPTTRATTSAATVSPTASKAPATPTKGTPTSGTPASAATATVTKTTPAGGPSPAATRRPTTTLPAVTATSRP